MQVRPDLPPETARHCIETLRTALDHILNVGNHTLVDRRSSPRYANVIIDINSVIDELKKCLP